MDSEPVSHLLSEDDEEEVPQSLTQIFRDQFPFYLHLGMSYDEYWRMDCELVRAYRKAYEYRQEYDNSQLWLQGLYIYKAIEAQRPGWVFYGKKAPKPEKYLEKPLAVTEELKHQYEVEKTQEMVAKFKAAFKKRNDQNLDEEARAEEGKDHGESSS